MEEILKLFTKTYRIKLSNALKSHAVFLEEIRLRINQPLELIFSDRSIHLDELIFAEGERIYFINQLSQFSLYRLQDELREGFITIKGGHRVGLAGTVFSENNIVKYIKHLTFFNIRIARQINDVAFPIIKQLFSNNQLNNTLIIGPPQTGKTTLLRDLARLLSDGSTVSEPKKVVIIDERSELAACRNGVPQLNIGQRTDILDACPKHSGFMMAIRSLSPEVIIADEIGGELDVAAILEAVFAGVTIICSVHGDSIWELKQRPSLQILFKNSVFKRYIMLERGQYVSTKPMILTEKYESLFS